MTHGPATSHEIAYQCLASPVSTGRCDPERVADMQTATRPAGYAHREVTQPPNWHGLVVWDVFFNALATGLFLVAAVGELAAPTAFAPVSVWAFPLALVFLLIDLALLVLDLGDP